MSASYFLLTSGYFSPALEKNNYFLWFFFLKCFFIYTDDLICKMENFFSGKVPGSSKEKM